MVPNFLYIESGICPFSVMAECNNRKMFVYIMNREVNTVKKVSYTFSPELDKKQFNCADSNRTSLSLQIS